MRVRPRPTRPSTPATSDALHVSARSRPTAHGESAKSWPEVAAGRTTATANPLTPGSTPPTAGRVQPAGHAAGDPAGHAARDAAGDAAGHAADARRRRPRPRAVTCCPTRSSPAAPRCAGRAAASSRRSAPGSAAARIESVTFFMDGRRMKRVTSGNASLRVAPSKIGFGRHRIVALVQLHRGERDPEPPAAAHVPALRAPGREPAVHRLSRRHIRRRTGGPERSGPPSRLRARPRRPARVDEGGDQPVGLVLLGVPEHAEHEAPRGVLDRLGGAVALRARRDPQAGADARDALVVRSS